MSILIRALIALIMVPFLLDKLGKDAYGLIGLMGVIVGLAGVADLGLRGALGRELSEQVTKKNDRSFGELASSALLLYIFIALCLSMIGWLLAPWLADIFKVSEELHSDAVLMIRLYGTFTVVLSFITPVFSACLSSHDRFDLINVVQITGSILMSVLLFFVLSNTENVLWSWVVVMMVYQLIVLLMSIALFVMYCGEFRIGVGYVRFGRLKPLFQLGGYMYALKLTQTLAARSDPLVISYFFGPAGVALYQPAGKLSEMIRPVVTMLAEQLYPLTTRQHLQNKQQEMQVILITGTKFILVLGVLVSVCMFFFAEPFCRLWLMSAIGEDYLIVARLMMGWAIVDFTTYAAGTQWPVLLGMKNLTFLVWTQLPAAVLNVLVSIYLVGFTEFGIAGVLVATIIIGIIRRPIIAWHTSRVCGLPIVEYFKQAYLRPIVCLIFPAFTAVILRMFYCSSWIGLSLCVAATGFVWFFTVCCICVNEEERNVIKKLFSDRLS